MIDENFFTEKEFARIREEIDKLFKDDLFSVKKSTFVWSSKHSWIISVEAKIGSTRMGSNDSIYILKSTSSLLEKAAKFSEKNEFNLKLISIYSIENFSFTFNFQPTVIYTMKLLSQ